MNEKSSFRDTYASSQLEQDSSNEPLAANEAKEVYPQESCRLVFTHYRKRKCDVDNLSTKALIDGFRAIGVWADDTPEFIKEVTHRFEKAPKGSEEKIKMEIIYEE